MNFSFLRRIKKTRNIYNSLIKSNILLDVGKEIKTYFEYSHVVVAVVELWSQLIYFDQKRVLFSHNKEEYHRSLRRKETTHRQKLINNHSTKSQNR
jgi:hypothetical protein